MLNEDAVLEHRDLGAVTALADHYRALDGLPAREELRLGDHRRAAAAGFPALATALLLRLQPRGALDRAHIVGQVVRLTHVHDRVRRVIRCTDVGIGASPAPLAPPAATRGTKVGQRHTGAVLSRLILFVLGVRVLDVSRSRPRRGLSKVGGIRVAPSPAAGAPAAPTATA